MNGHTAYTGIYTPRYRGTKKTPFHTFHRFIHRKRRKKDDNQPFLEKNKKKHVENKVIHMWRGL